MSFRRSVLTGLITLFACLGAQGQTTREASRPVRVVGTVQQVDGFVVLVRLRYPAGDQTDVQVTADKNTTVIIDGDPASLAELAPGMGIAVRESVRRPSDTSAPLHIVASSPALSGTIEKLDGNTVTVAVVQRGEEPKTVDVQTNDKTRVFLIGFTADGHF